MKYSTFKAVALALTLSGPLFFASTTAADAVKKTAIPETVDAILQAIDAKSAKLKKTIDSGALDGVHHQAFAIRDLVAALPAKSSSLPAAKLARVRGEAKFVATLADRLDATGDAKDLAGTKANYAKLSTVLASIHGHYAPTK